MELDENDLALEFLTKAIQIDQNLALDYYWRGFIKWFNFETNNLSDNVIDDLTKRYKNKNE